MIHKRIHPLTDKITLIYQTLSQLYLTLYISIKSVKALIENFIVDNSAESPYRLINTDLKFN